ncbi:MAG: TerB family tellurite resistance protein [Polyangiaceae bacterium]
MKIDTATIARLRDALIQSGRRQAAVISSAYETLTRQGLLSEEEQAAVARIEPMVETMFMVMAADGRISAGEMDAIRGAVRGLTEGLLQEGTIKVMLEGCEKRLEQEGRAARLDALTSQLREDREDAEGAFALAAAIAMADHEVASEENTLILDLGERLGIGTGRAEAILEQLEEERSDEGAPDTDRNPSTT